jgi:hypothetical protein
MRWQMKPSNKKVLEDDYQCFFCTSKIQHGQDRVFLSRGGLTNYKAHYGLFWFRPLLGGNSPMSSGLILKMNSGYNEVSRELEKFTK